MFWDENYGVSSFSSPVPALITLPTGIIKILPSPVWPVSAFLKIASITSETIFKSEETEYLSENIKDKYQILEFIQDADVLSIKGYP